MPQSGRSRPNAIKKRANKSVLRCSAVQPMHRGGPACNRFDREVKPIGCPRRQRWYISRNVEAIVLASCHRAKATLVDLSASESPKVAWRRSGAIHQKDITAVI